MEDLKLDHLGLLLKASSKDFIVSLFDESFALRDLTSVPITTITSTAKKLGVSQNEARLTVTVCVCVLVMNQKTVSKPETILCRTETVHNICIKTLHIELKSLIKRAVFIADTNRKDLERLLPDNLNKNLSDLIINTIIGRLPQWKLYVANNLVFLPRLVDFDWRVDVKTASDSLSRIAVPTCLLQLQVQESASRSGVVPPTSCINVELSRQTLDTMLDGLSKIRDQLSSVANKQ